MAFDFPNSPTDGQIYSPAGGPDYIYRAATTVWEIQTSGTNSAFVAKAGDIMSGTLTIRMAGPILALDRSDSAYASIFGTRATKARWAVVPGDGTAETGTGNTGSDFGIYSYNDAGTFLGTPFKITRSNSLAEFAAAVKIAGTLTLQNAAVGTAIIMDSAPNNQSSIQALKAGKLRWNMLVSNQTAESGGNVGSDFQLFRYTDAGVLIDSPLLIRRNDGVSTFNANVVVSAASPVLMINKTASGQNAAIQGTLNAVNRWVMSMGTQTPETGGNAGSDWGLWSYADNGAQIAAAFTIYRSNSAAVFANSVTSHGIMQVDMVQPTLYLDKPATNSQCVIYGRNAYRNRWGLFLGDQYDDFSIGRWDTGGGTFVGPAVQIAWSSGNITLNGQTMMANPHSSNGQIGLHCGAGGAQGAVSFYDEWGGFRSSHYWSGSTGDSGIYYATNGACLWLRGDGYTFSNVNAFKPGGGPWADSSDARIKNVLGNYTNGLEAILALKPVRFIYKGNDTREPPTSVDPRMQADRPDLGDPKAGPRTVEPRAEPEPKAAEVPYITSHHHLAAKKQEVFIGLVAQDAEKAVPECITLQEGYIDGEKVDDIRMLDQGPLIFALINSIKQLKTLNDGLATQVGQLAARLSMLEAAA